MIYVCGNSVSKYIYKCKNNEGVILTNKINFWPLDQYILIYLFYALHITDGMKLKHFISFNIFITHF